MTKLLEVKELLKGIYGKYDFYIIPVLKFILALITFISINKTLGYMSVFNNPLVVLVLALMCSFLPITGLVLFSVFVILAHLFAVSIEFAIVGVILALLMLILYFRFGTGDAIALILTPIAFGLNIPCTVPIVFGLTGSPISGVSIGCGTVVYFFLVFAKQKASLIGGSSIEDMMQNFVDIINYMLRNQEMMLTLVSFIMVVIIVYFIRKLSVDHSWSIAIVTGAVTNVFIMIIGDFILDVTISLPILFIGTIVAVFISFIVQFFVFSVDYTGTKHVQFEDDEYYYYVKAIPKITIASPSFQVQRINPQKRRYIEEEVTEDFDDEEVFSNIDKNEY